MQLIGEIGTQVSDIVRTEGLRKAKEEAKAELAKQGTHEPGQGADPKAVEDYQNKLVATEAYQKIMGKHGTSGDYQRVTQAVTAALQGLAGGNIGSALAGASAPYLAQLIKKSTGDNAALNVMAHAVLGAVVAQAQGNSAAAGAAGAAGGELSARLIAQQLYGTSDTSALSEEQKQTISALSTLAAGLSGGLVEGNSAGAVTGAGAGRNAVENNYLSKEQKAQKAAELASCDNTACTAQKEAKWLAIDVGQDGSFAAGMIAGVPEGLYDTVKGIVQTASSPGETFDALKSLFQSDDVLGNIADAVKQSYIERIDQMEAEYERAGAGGSFKAGVEGGKLLSEIAALLGGGVGAAKVSVNVTEKIVTKVASKAGSLAASANKRFAFDIGLKWLPDANGRLHATAVKGDARVPLDKVELYMRGKSSGDLGALQTEYESLRSLRAASQKEFAKNPENEARLRLLSSQMHNVERSRDMARVLDSAGIIDTAKNNKMIIAELLASARDITVANRRSSIVLSGPQGNVRVNATWTILDDGSKRLSTMQVGAFK
ncbi:VENN motif pre-toxin domain-containing protein [Pseudomonas muyukensis]|uniref:VENN motif pre-toxin domain-containing protein n=1 Tax=Pseudomonas muyukensis TaxID=2842357 RepID=UPI00266CCF47|nr:VENN motif pre-toxin domain-containing protein [Pseudomonas muyukensis]